MERADRTRKYTASHVIVLRVAINVVESAAIPQAVTCCFSSARGKDADDRPLLSNLFCLFVNQFGEIYLSEVVGTDKKRNFRVSDI